MIAVIFALAGAAQAQVDERCQELASQGTPPDYSEQGQQDFLLNFFSGATTFSALHGPVPHDPGRGSVGIELAGIPPLGCKRRLVLDYSKTEDTNKTPVAPRIRAHAALPQVGAFVPWFGAGYMPPVTVLGTRNVIASLEAGVGMRRDSGFELGLRYHATLMKTVSDIATAFSEDDPDRLDFYVGSTLGADLMAGWDLGAVTAWASVGALDVSTYFWVGDDGAVVDNYDPYAGITGSLGAQWTATDHLDIAAELYGVPGLIGTLRLRAGWVF